MHRNLLAAALLCIADAAQAQADLDALIDAVEPKVIAWRRHIHQNPELSFQEVKTAAYIAEALRNVATEYLQGAGKGR